MMDKIDFLQSFKKLQNLATDLGPVLALFRPNVIRLSLYGLPR